jgi:hypothetical protein
MTLSNKLLILVVGHNSHIDIKAGNMKLIKGTSVILCLLALTHQISGCGSAEPIKSYIYPTTKYNLEKAVLKVLHTNPHIVMDTTELQVTVKRFPDNPNDTATDIINLSDYHGSDSASIAANQNGVIQIKIKVGDIDNDYVFRYLGDEEHWKSSKNSAIFIQYAGDKKGNSLSQGLNVSAFKSQMAKDFTSLFEREVVSKIDNELNIKHTDRLGPLNDLK